MAQEQWELRDRTTQIVRRVRVESSPWVQGGFGKASLWKGVAEWLPGEPPVVVKMTRGSSPVSALHTEGVLHRMAGAHPNIIPLLLDAGPPPTVGGLEIYEYLVSPLAGPSITELVAVRGCAGPDLATVVTVDLVAALAHLDAKGIVHRDVQPTNVHVVLRGGRLLAVLIDFGNAVDMGVFARVGADGVFPSHTDALYVAPEAIGIMTPDRPLPPPDRRTYQVEQRSDVWGAALTALYALAKHTMFALDPHAPYAVQLEMVGHQMAERTAHGAHNISVTKLAQTKCQELPAYLRYVIASSLVLLATRPTARTLQHYIEVADADGDREVVRGHLQARLAQANIHVPPIPM
jgi:predicted Ser/Thr protein kinase